MGTGVAIFLDGGYIDKATEKLGIYRLDYNKLIDILSEGDEVIKVNYYHCMPYRNTRIYFKKRMEFGDLAAMPRTEVKLGRLVKDGIDMAGNIRYKQKRVDTQLSTDFVLSIFSEKISKMVLVAGDDDFVPTLQWTLKLRSDLPVTLWHFDAGHISDELVNYASQTKIITHRIMEECVLHKTYEFTGALDSL